MAEANGESDADTIDAERKAELLDEIQLVSIDDLDPYVNNPKQHPTEQVKKIASSIRNFGWDVPIVVDGDLEIIKGHGRYQAAKHLGLSQVPVIVRDDISKADARASRIADNRVAESEWQDETLLTEIESLQDTGFSVEDLGFDDDELDDLMGDEWDDDLSMDDLAAPSTDSDTTVSLDFEDEMDYEDALDWFEGMMATHDLDSREDVIIHLAGGGENAGW